MRIRISRAGRRDGFSRGKVVVFVVFLALAAVVDWFLVPHFQERGFGVVAALLLGSYFVVVIGWVLLFAGFRVVRFLRRGSATRRSREI